MFFSFLALSGCLMVQQAQLGDELLGPDGITRDEFRTGWSESLCDLAVDCGILDLYGGTISQCEDEQFAAVTDYLTSDCVYDGAAAEGCLEELQQLSCSRLEAIVYPSDCTAICEG